MFWFIIITASSSKYFTTMQYFVQFKYNLWFMDPTCIPELFSIIYSQYRSHRHRRRRCHCYYHNFSYDANVEIYASLRGINKCWESHVAARQADCTLPGASFTKKVSKRGQWKSVQIESGICPRPEQSHRLSIVSGSHPSILTVSVQQLLRIYFTSSY